MCCCVVFDSLQERNPELGYTIEREGGLRGLVVASYAPQTPPTLPRCGSITLDLSGPKDASTHLKCTDPRQDKTRRDRQKDTDRQAGRQTGRLDS